jgi:hypothetical protein
LQLLCYPSASTATAAATATPSSIVSPKNCIVGITVRSHSSPRGPGPQLRPSQTHTETKSTTITGTATSVSSSSALASTSTSVCAASDSIPDSDSKTTRPLHRLVEADAPSASVSIGFPASVSVSESVSSSDQKHVAAEALSATSVSTYITHSDSKVHNYTRFSKYMWLAVQSSVSPGSTRSFAASTLKIEYITIDDVKSALESGRYVPPHLRNSETNKKSHSIDVKTFLIVHHDEKTDKDHNGVGHYMFSVHPNEVYEHTGFGLVYPVRYIYGRVQKPQDMKDLETSSSTDDAVGFFSVAHEMRNFAFARCLIKLDMCKLGAVVGISQASQNELDKLQFTPETEPEHYKKNSTEIRVELYKRLYHSELYLLSAAVNPEDSGAFTHPRLHEKEAWRNIDKSSDQYATVAKDIRRAKQEWSDQVRPGHAKCELLHEQLRKADTVLREAWKLERHIYRWQKKDRDNKLINAIYRAAISTYIDREKPWTWLHCARHVTFEWYKSIHHDGGNPFKVHGGSSMFKKEELHKPFPPSSCLKFYIPKYQWSMYAPPDSFDKVLQPLLFRFGVTSLRIGYLRNLFDFDFPCDSKLNIGIHIPKLYKKLSELELKELVSALAKWDELAIRNGLLELIEYGSHQVRARLVHWCLLDLQARKLQETPNAEVNADANKQCHITKRPSLEVLQSILKPAIELHQFTYVNDAILVLCMCDRLDDVMKLTRFIVQTTKFNLTWMSYTKFALSKIPTTQIDLHACQKNCGHFPSALLWYFLSVDQHDDANLCIDAVPGKFKYGDPVTVVTGWGSGNRKQKVCMLQQHVTNFFGYLGANIENTGTHPDLQFGAIRVTNYKDKKEADWKTAFSQLHTRYYNKHVLEGPQAGVPCNSHPDSDSESESLSEPGSVHSQSMSASNNASSQSNWRLNDDYSHDQSRPSHRRFSSSSTDSTSRWPSSSNQDDNRNWSNTPDSRSQRYHGSDNKNWRC